MFNGVKGGVSIKKVLELLLMCRGDNTTTVQSMAGAILSIINRIREMQHILQNELQKDTSMLETELNQGTSGLRRDISKDMRQLRSQLQGGLGRPPYQGGYALPNASVPYPQTQDLLP